MKIFGITILCLLFTCPLSFANKPQIKLEAAQHDADIEFAKLYHNLAANSNLATRIAYFSHALLNRPYVLGPLGEGSKALYDHEPLYRSDVFDCTTFVETVLALSLSNDVDQFKEKMNHIRYKNGEITFITRNHFTSLDWNTNNRRILTDITQQITDEQGRPIYKMATATIDKPAWYANFTLKNIELNDVSKKVRSQRLEELKVKAKELPIKQANIPYLPLTRLFLKGQPVSHLFDQIPNASVIEIVRPNWNLKNKIGTCLNVSHLGFAIRKHGKLYFREASLTHKKVTDTLLSEYLKKFTNSPTIKGINVQTVHHNKKS